VRTSISQATMVMPMDFGNHQRWKAQAGTTPETPMASHCFKNVFRVPMLPGRIHARKRQRATTLVDAYRKYRDMASSLTARR
jgi:hypothetical protein